MAITLEQGALRWEKAINTLPQMVKKELVYAKRDMVTGALDFLRDDPKGPLWRERTDGGPLRIVTGRLWESLRGHEPLRGYSNLPAVSRRYPIAQGGRSEHFYRSPKAITQKTKIKGTVSFGTRTEYAEDHERGENGMIARPYFYPGVRMGFATKTLPRLRLAAYRHFKRKLR